MGPSEQEHTKAREPSQLHNDYKRANQSSQNEDVVRVLRGRFQLPELRVNLIENLLNCAMTTKAQSTRKPIIPKLERGQGIMKLISSLRFVQQFISKDIKRK